MTEEKNAHIIHITGHNPHRKLIVVGGMHGNEINGVEAIKRLIPQLEKVLDKTNGTIYFLKGNLQALQTGERFIEQDLNRLWLEDNIQKPVGQVADFKALHTLHDLIVNDICQGKFEQCSFLDLHTFSAQSGIFAIPACNQKSIDFAKSFGVPFIEKLSESLPGTALSYFGRLGMTSVVFEGGTHRSAEATDNLEAGLWHSLAYLGFIKPDLPQVVKSRSHLEKISESLPHHLELIYRHKLNDYHRFKMNDGYFNFKPVKKAENLAVQNQSVIKSPESGFMLMPLYQKKGSDGFFIVKEK